MICLSFNLVFSAHLYKTKQKWQRQHQRKSGKWQDTGQQWILQRLFRTCTKKLFVVKISFQAKMVIGLPSGAKAEELDHQDIHEKFVKKLSQVTTFMFQCRRF